jgi:(R)-amidase
LTQSYTPLQTNGPEKMKNMKIQLVQIPSEDGVTAPNVERILSVIHAADPQTDLIVFPETCLMGFPSADEAKLVSEPVDGPALSKVLQAVKARDISVVLGFAELEAGRFYNSTVLLSPQGVVLKYQKTHLWATDVGTFEPGKQLVTAVWNGVRVGILICFDIEFPENARALAAQGAELLLVTNGNMDPFGPVHRALIVARAIENQVFAVMANRCGEGGGLVFAGESVVVSPFGRIIASLGREEGSLVAEIDLAEVQQSRTEYSYLKQRRLPLAGQVVSLSGAQTAHLIP